MRGNTSRWRSIGQHDLAAHLLAVARVVDALLLERAPASARTGCCCACATSRSASFSISSGTCTPSRPARWTWISCRIRRSSTCWRMTSAGGSCEPWPRSRSAISAICVVELALQHDALVDDRDHAVERDAARGHVARLGAGGAGRQQQRAQQSGQDSGHDSPGSGVGWSEAGEYPRMARSRKVSLRVPTDERPVSSTCSRIELSLSPVRLDT